MANPLVRRTKKWTYLTWCDLRNHPMMLVGALVGAIAFAAYYVQQDDTNKRIGSVEHTVRVPRRCTVAHLPHTPSNVVILFCNPATAKEVATAEARARKIARETAHRRAARRKVAGRTGGQNRGPSSRRKRSPNGNQEVAPSPSRPSPPPRPSHQPSGSPSGGGSSSPTSRPSPRASPSPGVTTPSVGPIPSITVPLPSPSLPPLPGSRQLTGR